MGLLRDGLLSEGYLRLRFVGGLFSGGLILGRAFTVFVQKAFWLGLFSSEIIFRGAFYQKEFCFLKWVWLVTENQLKTIITA